MVYFRDHAPSYMQTISNLSCISSFRYPEILQHLEISMSEINATVVPPSNLAWDPRADPRFWDHTWTNFGDYSILSNAVS
jgi:hypothetical protein